MADKGKLASAQRVMEFLSDVGESGGKAAKEAELVEAGVNAARKESGSINPYKKGHGTTRSYTQATKALKPSSSKPSSAGASSTRSYSEGVSKAVETEKLQRNAQSSTRQQVNKKQHRQQHNT